jgi:hypothetical protein
MPERILLKILNNAWLLKNLMDVKAQYFTAY